jgi:hypothetical protein
MDMVSVIATASIVLVTIIAIALMYIDHKRRNK